MFISLEGIEGCGKTTQLEYLSNFLKEHGRSCVVTREPGGTAIGKKIRSILLDPASKELVPAAELLLYMADRAQHIDSLIKPRLAEGKIVLCDRYFDCRPLVVGKPECELPVEVRVDNPAEVGADRLVNTVSAYQKYGGDLIVVDFGTATTFDVIGHDGAYVGGVIAPGVNLSLDALHQAAAHLPRVDAIG